MRSVTTDEVPHLNKVVDAATIIDFQRLVRRIPVAEDVFEYAANLVRATRADEEEAPDFVKKLMAWGRSSCGNQSNTRGQGACGTARTLLRFH